MKMVTSSLEIHLSNMDNMNLRMLPSVFATSSYNLDPHPDEPMSCSAVVHL